MAVDIVVVGGGPSGLAAAYEGVNRGATVTVLERLGQVGGLCRTLEFDGCRFDIGPHRFFTKNAEVRDLFHRVLGDDLISVRRQTRIFHDGIYFDYPLTPLNAMTGIGLRAGLRIAGSYAAARIRGRVAPKPPESFEDWVVDRFGRELFARFFQTYTEKVWGVPCDQIGADWAAQRIRGLSLGVAIRNALSGNNSSEVKTLIDEFVYPRLGAGHTYEKLSALVVAGGGCVRTGCTVQQLRREGSRIRALVMSDSDGHRHEIEGRHFLTSASLTDTIEMIDPPPPDEVLRAGRALRYRDHIGVNLVVKGAVFPDNWIYVHTNQVAVARISSYRNFSPEMASAADVSPITAEYFAFPGDALSSATDEQLIDRAIQELQRLGIIKRERVIDGFVVRNAKAYPVIEIGYQEHVSTIKAWLDGLENLVPIGRSGMFKYNNQDHAIATGLLAARRVLGLGRFDPWLVNIDAEYQEDAGFDCASSEARDLDAARDRVRPGP
jgi:protoporphyrinogen oxidase